jgi:probable rRNA maturation factor
VTDVEISGSVPRLTRRDIVTFARRVLRAVDVEPGELSIAFVDDAAMRGLNRKFRRKNKTTDVLTFPGDAPLLGEIVISLDQARRQAVDEKHSIATEVRYLILHGILHALGYDHETDNGEMNALEVQVRAKVGLD